MHVWTGAFGIAVAVLGVKAFEFRRRLASIGLRDAVRSPNITFERVAHLNYSPRSSC